MANTMYQDKPLLGSQEEISMVKALGAENEASAKTIAAKVKQIEEPGYIIYDIETDCSFRIEGTDTYLHRPMIIEATKLKVRGAGSYEESFVASFSFDGYNCIEQFCIFLLREKTHRNSTVIAHNGGGYDNKFF